MSENKKLFILLIVFILYLILPGCATTSSNIPVEVKVPVPVKCQVETPTEPVISCYKDSDIFELTKCMIYEIKVRKSYEKELNVALESCK